MAGASASASVHGNFTYNGKEDSARSSILNEVDSRRDSASTFNIHSSPLVIVSHMALVGWDEMIQGLAGYTALFHLGFLFTLMLGGVVFGDFICAITWSSLVILCIFSY